MLNPRLEELNEYPFQRLAALLAPLDPRADLAPIDLSIGSPMHAPPQLLIDTLAANSQSWNRYPPSLGTPDFRQAAAEWLCRRYRLPEATIDPARHVLSVAGTKEALFLIAQTIMPQGTREQPAVLLPNPLYNVYLGAAVMAGAEPVLLTASEQTGYLPDLDRLTPELLSRTVAFYLCTPSNPQGAAASLDYLTRALELARHYDFLLIADECYSEIYSSAPPPGALQAAIGLGGLDHLMVCHSLSKRSSAAGLRSGFVAGDPAVIAGFGRLRNYAASVQPLPVLAAAAALWRDEAHVEANRALYRQKFDLAQEYLGGRLGFYRPDGGFFLWLTVEDGEQAARQLWTQSALKVIPGSYFAQADALGMTPGEDKIRVAMVHDLETTETALRRIAETLN
ncbi:MAG: aminotransferase class I/II-fold pyridoxal phosphate-dependent enzyme [Pseudomonadota bacterium]